MNISSGSGRTRGVLARIFMLGLAAIPLAAESRTIHVAPGGADTADGGSWNRALRSIQAAVDRAGPGDTVIVRAGPTPYAGFQVRRSGRAEAPVVIRGEDPGYPPVLSGASVERNWQRGPRPGTWAVVTSAEPLLMVADSRLLRRASTAGVQDGDWYYDGKRVLYRPASGDPARHIVWRPSRGGGVVLKDVSHVVVENFICRIGQGACVSITRGQRNVVRNVISRWFWRGINIQDGSNDNLVEDCLVKDNSEGIYILRGSHRNVIRRCRALGNGNFPAWTRGDRAGIAIGEVGPNIGNVVEDCEVARNGGPDSDAGLIAYAAPDTVLARNHVHNNFGSGIFITIGSNDSLAVENRVEMNGIPAVAAGLTNIAGLSVRRSRGVTVSDNKVLGNYVAADSPWAGNDLGPRGGLEIRGLTSDDMSGISLLNNVVSGTQGGPDIYVVPGLQMRGLRIQTPQ